MLSITVLAVGGLKESYFTDACAEYRKRLTAFCRPQIVEIPEYRLGQNPGEAEIEKCLIEEGKAILAKIPPRACVMVLCVEGKTLSSTELAARIEKAGATASQIVLVIGGSHGLSPEVKARAEFSLSMSPMTFPHQLARVMLLEQLYRAFTINAGMKYHK